MFCEQGPQPDPSRSLYRDGAYFRNPEFGSSQTGGYHGYRDYLADRRHIEAKFEDILAHVECLRKPGDLLDVGAGPGFLISAAARRGWRALGIDVNRWAADYARNVVGVDVRVGSLEDGGLEPESFDVVTMMDLLEHVGDPSGLVGAARRALRPDGILAVLTPDAGSPVSRALGVRWPEVQRVPEHLVLFSLQGLSRLLERHGFEVLGWHPVGKTSDVRTLVADVSPAFPAVGARAAWLVDRTRVGDITVDLDPHTKFCLYGRRASEDPVLVNRPRRPTRLTKRPPPDIDGDQTILQDLTLLAEAPGLCDWLFAQYAGAVGQRVAEIGAGIGTFTERMLAAGAEEILAVEPHRASADRLEQRFGHDNRVTVARETLPDSASLARGGFDLVVCQNVLEHIPAHFDAAAAMAAALRPGGQLTVVVPAHPWLFGTLDESYGHYRRYTRSLLVRVLEQAELEVSDVHSFNLLGLPGWWLTRRRRRTRIKAGPLAIYERLLPAWRPLEDRLEPPWGLSIVAHARRR